jgi:hypothetical protein
MTGRMRWDLVAKLHGRRTLDHRYENDVPDRGARWLAAVERNQAQRRQHSRERRSFSGSTRASSL